MSSLNEENVKHKSVDIEVSADIIDELVSSQLNINLGEIFKGCDVISSITIDFPNYDEKITSVDQYMYCAFSSAKNSDLYCFKRLEQSVNILPPELVFPLSKIYHHQLWLVMVNVPKEIQQLRFNITYYDETEVIQQNSDYDLCVDENSCHLKICGGMWVYKPSQDRSDVVKLFNDAFSEFKNSDKDVKYYHSSDAIKIFTSKNKDIFLYKETLGPSSIKHISKDCDFIFAIKHTHNKPLKCVLLQHINTSTTLNEFIAVPNKIEWLLNETPLLIVSTAYCDISCHFYDVDTGEEVFINVDFFKGLLKTTEHRRTAVTKCFLGHVEYNTYLCHTGMGMLLKLSINASNTNDNDIF